MDSRAGSGRLCRPRAGCATGSGGATAVSAACAGDSRAHAAPESVGVSSERLGRLHAGMQAFVDRHEAGGIVTLVARDGKVVDVHTSGLV